MNASYLGFRKTPQFYKSWGGATMCDMAGQCNFSCSFCWAQGKHERPGMEKSPQEVWDIVKLHGMGVACLTCTEPLLHAEHVIEVAQIFAQHEKEESSSQLIIETNGSLLTKEIAQRIGIHENVYVRVSVKGTDATEFASITGMPPDLYEKVWQNIRGALLYVNMWVACISPKRNFSVPKRICKELDPGLANLFEVEKIIDYSNKRR